MPTTEDRAADAGGPQRREGLPLLKLLVWIAAAGAAGSVLRLVIGVPFEEHFMKFPWATLLINTLGSAALGLLVGVAHVWRSLPSWTVPVLGTGLLGSFTTFSAVMVAAVASQQRDLFAQTAGDDVIPPGLWEILAYVGVSVLFCTAAAAAGVTVGRAIFGCTGLDCEHAAGGAGGQP
ncbi:CrcB family protein [Nesterenkonia sp.]|uniref:fluoride efflux transporter FluC n=1 Tax=Nesterenkonia sp. TaxID=704201 RepID=UPI0026100C97|nr:CrcB family protein [Nesterenkonia sp.]